MIVEASTRTNRLGEALLAGGFRWRAPRCLLERFLQRPRPVVLGQQVGEGLIGKRLQILAALARGSSACQVRRSPYRALGSRAQAVGDVGKSRFLGVTDALAADTEEGALDRCLRHFLANGA